MRGLLRFLFQLVLIILVIFFGYNYFTKPELKSCVAQPIADLSTWQKENNMTFDGVEVQGILQGIQNNLSAIGDKGGQLWDSASGMIKRADEASESSDLSSALITEAQYMYCSDVVTKYQTQ